jgi:NADPH:quinone reductase-like Zn-dependent oxidoreductase
VAAVGGNVSTFSVGDPVVAFLDAKMGGHAEYALIKETGLIVAKPANLSFEAAASLCFGGMTARDYIRKAQLKTGESLLVIGASGAVGQTDGCACDGGHEHGKRRAGPRPRR